MSKTSKSLLLLLLIFLAGCYEPREGCLDINAANFSVDADRPCADCCSYPALRMSFLHQSVYADTTVNFRLLDSVYYDAGGNPYRVKDFRFFLSDVRLARTDGTEVSLSNRLVVKMFRSNGTLESDSITNDILLVRPLLTAKNDLGTLRANGVFNRLRFSIGISDLTATVDPESLPSNHPLRPASSGMQWSTGDGYEFQRALFLPGAAPGDTTSVAVHIRQPTHRRTVELPINIDVPQGFNLEFDIRIDYLGWLRDVSPATQTPGILLEKLNSRTTGAFSIVNIRYVSR